MQAESGESGTWAGGWMIAAVAGIVAAILARMIGDVGMSAAVLVGVLVFGVFGVLLGSGGVEQVEAHDEDHGHDLGHGHGHGHVAPVAPVAAAPVMAAPVVAPVEVAPVVVAAPVVAVPVAEPVAAGVLVQPKGLAAARAGGADDLKVIEGIGPAMEKLCNGLGFFHFDQIAAWSAADVAWVDENLKGFKGRATRDRWVAQAALIGAVGIPEFQRRAKTNDY